MLNMSRSCAPAARNASHLTFQILVVGLVKFMFEQHHYSGSICLGQKPPIAVARPFVRGQGRRGPMPIQLSPNSS